MYRAPTRGLAPIPQRARMGLAALKGRRLQEQERPASESGPYKTGDGFATETKTKTKRKTKTGKAGRRRGHDVSCPYIKCGWHGAALRGSG